MGAPAAVFKSKITDWRERLALTTATMRAMSLQTDPQEMRRIYLDRMRHEQPLDGSVSLSRRGLKAPWVRITRPLQRARSGHGALLWVGHQLPVLSTCESASGGWGHHPGAGRRPVLRGVGADQSGGCRVEGGMSRYAVNSLLYRLKKDREFRARFSTDPRAALADADLTEAERAAFLARDMQRINELGGYLHLVLSIPGLAVH